MNRPDPIRNTRVPMIPRRTITLYPGMAADCLRVLASPPPGDPVSVFENRFAAFLGVRHAVAAASGTDAMLLILDGLGLRPGDHVLSTAYTIRPLMDVFRGRGYDLGLVDISPSDCNIDPDDLAQKLRPDTKTVIITHMFGTPARMDELRAVLSGHPCKVVEDAAHAHGATYRGRMCGTLGDAAFFSLDQVKPLSTFGGGMAVTSDGALAAAMRSGLAADPPAPRRTGKIVMGWIEHAVVNSPAYWLVTWLTRFETARELIGAVYRKFDRRPPTRNRRLSAGQAVLGLRQLDHLAKRNATRRANADRIAARFTGLVRQAVPDDSTSTYYKFVAISDADSAVVKERLFRAGIDVGIKDDINYPCYRELNLPEDEFPGTHRVYEHLIELPAYETLRPRQLARIADALADIP